MAKHKIATLSKVEVILARGNVPCGTYPGANRSRKFVNKAKRANKYKCRGKVRF